MYNFFTGNIKNSDIKIKLNGKNTNLKFDSELISFLNTISITKSILIVLS